MRAKGVAGMCPQANQEEANSAKKDAIQSHNLFFLLSLPLLLVSGILPPTGTSLSAP